LAGLPPQSGSAAPSITTQPQSQEAILGQDVSLSVTASGAIPLSYQWYFNTNTLLPGAAGSTLTITNFSTNSAGAYSVIVTNSSGSATSSFAILTLAFPPTNGDFYVATNGNDSNPGTFSAPFYSVSKATSLAQPGNIIYVRGGTYSY